MTPLKKEHPIIKKFTFVNDDPRRQESANQQMMKVESKGMGLKRVSFGSSKGSMVETLVFEKPTPLFERNESDFGAEFEQIAPDDVDKTSKPSDHSVVRVSIYQSNQPQNIYSEYYKNLEYNLNNFNYDFVDEMTATATMPSYDRQQSTDSGWDNPFRPDGDLSREADEIVNMIRGGKPITPTEHNSLASGQAQIEKVYNKNNAQMETVTEKSVTQIQSSKNGVSSSIAKSSDNNGATATENVSKQVVPGPTSASHVVIDEKKNKKKGCCTIQ